MIELAGAENSAFDVVYDTIQMSYNNLFETVCEGDFLEQEILKIFSEDGRDAGVATRADVHKYGHWHEAFHCWFVAKEAEETFIYLQLRSPKKKDNANLYDITAAGHLLATETVEDGVREIEEELGIAVAYTDLDPLGIIPYSMRKEDFIDNEFANVFLLEGSFHMADFSLQEEEVAGIVKTSFRDFYALWLGEKESVCLQGFKVPASGVRVAVNEEVKKDAFVAHPLSYYEAVLKAIRSRIES